MKKNILISFGTRPEAIKLAKLIYQLKKNKNVKIGFLGATYKANSEDLRESPSLKIMNSFLYKKKIKTYVAEPNIEREKFKYLNVTTTKNLIKKSDIIVILVNHNEFKKLKTIKNKKVLDISGLLNQN